MGVVIETQDLSRAFRGELALDGLTIDVEEGEVLALLGPNGAGKTTTIRLLNGILRPDRGRATVLGLDPASSGDEVRRRTGVLTEAAGLDDRLTARENLVLVGRIREMGARSCGARADELLERLGMAQWSNMSVRGFSTGQRKRVALALALLHDPEVLFLDEPTSGLDPAATRDVLDLIASLATERQRTIVVCTHFLGDAGRLCQRMAVLDRGRLQAFGTPEALAAELWDGLDVDIDLAAPADVATVAFIGRAPGVLSCETTPHGALVRVGHRDAIPGVVQALTAGRADVYGVTPRPPTLEDVYFAVQRREVDA